MAARLTGARVYDSGILVKVVTGAGAENAAIPAAIRQNLRRFFGTLAAALAALAVVAGTGVAQCYPRGLIAFN